MPRYETFDVLDERRLTAFLCREEPALHLRDLTSKVFSSIKVFLENLEVLENGLNPLQQLDDPFKAMAGSSTSCSSALSPGAPRSWSTTKRSGGAAGRIRRKLALKPADGLSSLSNAGKQQIGCLLL